MVVRIKTGKTIRGALSYNEQKVMAGKAELILASRFACDLTDLGFTEKLTRFERLNAKNPKITTNTLHLSLNFSPYDQLDIEKMQGIAWDYMQRIGFGNQPFLVYKHDDAAHPHLHIVTTTIQPNGRPIKMHNIGKLKSEPARKAIETEFDLIPAESMKKEASLPLQPISLESTIYGEDETKRAISNIVREVTSSYHFSSLEELNAILNQYNVIADSGKPGTRMHAHKGLVYSMLDRHGNKVGIPIKASSIYTKPTLTSLETKFEKEKVRKHIYSSYTSKILEDFLKHPKQITVDQFKNWMARRKIKFEYVKDTKGQVIDIQFVDNMKKVVLTCQDLNIIPQQIVDKIKLPQQTTSISTDTNTLGQKQGSEKEFVTLSDMSLMWLQELLAPEYNQAGAIPDYLKKKRKKRKPKL